MKVIMITMAVLGITIIVIPMIIRITNSDHEEDLADDIDNKDNR